MPVVLAFLRWIAAILLGITLVIVCALVPRGGPATLAVAAILLVVVPLVVARRRPVIGSWLAAAMLAPAPLAALMAFDASDGLLIAYHEQCGTGAVAVWLVGVPFLATILGLLAIGLWRARRSFAPLWLPAGLLALLTALALLVHGGARQLRYGSANELDDVLARASLVELPAAAPGSTSTVTAAGLTVERRCGPETCALRLGREGGELHEPHHPHHEWAAGTPLAIHVLDELDLRILEGTRPYPSAPRSRLVFDLGRERLTDLDVRDVAPWFGPPATALGLLLLAVLAVASSMTVGTVGPLVWRRLGARKAPEDATAEDVIALRSTHLAVLVVAATPLLASLWLGSF
jgi:hypothetical protein